VVFQFLLERGPDGFCQEEQDEVFDFVSVLRLDLTHLQPWDQKHGAVELRSELACEVSCNSNVRLPYRHYNPERIDAEALHRLKV